MPSTVFTFIRPLPTRAVTSTIGGTAGKQLIRYGETQRLAGKAARARFAGGLGLLMNVTVGPLFDMVRRTSSPRRWRLRLPAIGDVLLRLWLPAAGDVLLPAARCWLHAAGCVLPAAVWHC